MARVTLLALFVTCLCSVAHAEQHRISAETLQSEDSDSAKQQAYYLKYRYTLNHPDDTAFIGAGIGTRTITDDAGRTEFNATTIEFQQPLSSMASFRFAGSALQSDDWSPWTAATALIIKPGERSYIELFAERDLVDTTAAIALENQVNTYGVSGDYRLSKDWVVVGALFRQGFRDGNSRKGQVVRLIWELNALEWMLWELKSKQLEAEFNGVGYFSPEILTEDTIAVTLRDVVFDGNATISLMLGGGRQTINHDFSQPLYLAELKVKGWLTDHWGAESRLGCKNSGDTSFAASDDDYRYCYADLGLFFAW